MIYYALALLFVAISLPLFYRIAKGPTIADRILSTDALVTLFACALVLFSVAYERAIYADVGVVVALLSCISTLVIARFMEAGKL